MLNLHLLLLTYFPSRGAFLSQKSNK